MVSMPDGEVVLLDEVVQVLGLAQLDVRPGIGHQAAHRGRVRTALVDRDLLGLAVEGYRPLEVTPCRGEVATGGEQEILRTATPCHDRPRALRSTRRVARNRNDSSDLE